MICRSSVTVSWIVCARNRRLSWHFRPSKEEGRSWGSLVRAVLTRSEKLTFDQWAQLLVQAAYWRLWILRWEWIGWCVNNVEYFLRLFLSMLWEIMSKSRSFSTNIIYNRIPTRPWILHYWSLAIAWWDGVSRPLGGAIDIARNPWSGASGTCLDHGIGPWADGGSNYLWAEHEMCIQ